MCLEINGTSHKIKEQTNIPSAMQGKGSTKAYKHRTSRSTQKHNEDKNIWAERRSFVMYYCIVKYSGGVG